MTEVSLGREMLSEMISGHVLWPVSAPARCLYSHHHQHSLQPRTEIIVSNSTQVSWTSWNHRNVKLVFSPAGVLDGGPAGYAVMRRCKTDKWCDQSLLGERERVLTREPGLLAPATSSSPSFRWNNNSNTIHHLGINDKLSCSGWALLLVS